MLRIIGYFKEIARNAELKGGFDRAVRSMMAVNCVDNSHYGNKK